MSDTRHDKIVDISYSKPTNNTAAASSVLNADSSGAVTMDSKSISNQTLSNAIAPLSTGAASDQLNPFWQRKI